MAETYPKAYVRHLGECDACQVAENRHGEERCRTGVAILNNPPPDPRPHKKYVPGPPISLVQIAVAAVGIPEQRDALNDGVIQYLYGLTKDGTVYRREFTGPWCPVSMETQGTLVDDGWTCEGRCDDDKATHRDADERWMCDSCDPPKGAP